MMTQTDGWIAPPLPATVMVQVTRDGRELTLDVASRALILMGERYRKQLGECVRDALLGDL